ncbi:MAG TPA: DUF979 domain-containing protein [Gemmatimonadaceae bacterium]|nr:DUF979 domain-containing protein [Gemmatimonadaceae bacterium]
MGALVRQAFALETVYVATGVVLAVFAAITLADRAHPRRLGSALFWLLLAVVFAFGGVMPHWLTGLLVLAMVALDGGGQVRPGSRAEAPRETQRAEARRLGDRIFLPVLVIPAVTFLFAVAFRLLKLDVSRGALVGLGYGGVLAMLAAAALTGGPVRTAMHEGRRLNDAMGAVNILPQLLASLGVVFAAAKVGDLVAGGIARVVPPGSLFLLALANCLSMALFTILLGNSFAAFPVIAAGVTAPLLLAPTGVDPAMVAIITLTAGSSGTLMTPMAANFNVVPAALLNMRDQYGVIRFQLPYALTIWALHVVLLWGMMRAMG